MALIHANFRLRTNALLALFYAVGKAFPARFLIVVICFCRCCRWRYLSRFNNWLGLNFAI